MRLLDDIEFSSDSRKRINSLLDLILTVCRGDLDTYASLTLGHNWIAEADHVYTVLWINENKVQPVRVWVARG